MIYSYVTLTGKRYDAQINRLLDLLDSVQQKHEFRDRLMRSPAEFILFADVCAVLYLLDRDPTDLYSLVQRAIDFGYLDHLERVPHRMMDIRLTLDWGRFRHSWAVQETYFSTSILAKPIDALFLDESAVYALTHVIMFYYGFGTKLDVTLPVHDAAFPAALARLLIRLVVCSCQEHHWDLLAELLLSWECVGFAVTPLIERAWATLLEEQKADGSFPGPERALTHPSPSNTTTIPLSEASFAYHYHTTLLAIIACSVRSVRRAHDTVFSTFPIPDEPPVPDLRAALQKAGHWFVQLLDTSLRDHHLDNAGLCKALIGLWICGKSTQEPDASLIARLRRVAARLELSGERGISVAEIPAALVMMSAAICTSVGIVIPAFNEFIEVASAILKRIPCDNPVADLPLNEKRVLLRQIGFDVGVAGVVSAEVVAYAAHLSLAAGLSDVRTLTMLINSYAAFGGRAEMGPFDSTFGDLVSGLTTHFLRQYDFETGCALLRAARYTDVRLDPGLEFLMFHQRPEGSFGFFGIEEPRLRQTLPDFDADRDLYLSVTLECVWTLAESASDWRLYTSLPALEKNAVSGSA